MLAEYFETYKTHKNIYLEYEKINNKGIECLDFITSESLFHHTGYECKIRSISTSCTVVIDSAIRNYRLTNINNVVYEFEVDGSKYGGSYLVSFHHKRTDITSTASGKYLYLPKFDLDTSYEEFIFELNLCTNCTIPIDLLKEIFLDYQYIKGIVNV